MCRLVLLAALLLSAGCARTSHVVEILAVGSGAVGSGADGSGSSSTQALLPTVDCGEYFVAEVEINGRGPYRMLLDTGASVTSISPGVSREIRSRRRIRSIRIGRFRARGRLRCEVHDLDQLSDALGTPIDGIVGHPVFRGLLVTYDFPRRLVHVRPGRLEPDAAGTVTTGRGMRPYMSARVGDLEFPVLIDTGSGHGLSLRHLDRYEFGVPPRPTGARVRLDGVHLAHRGRLGTDVALGPVTLQTPIVADSVSVDLVGQKVLRHFAITIDQASGLARFERPDGPLETPVLSHPYTAIGVAAVPDDEAYSVHRVFEDAPAFAAGLRAGDRILAVNGIPVAERGCSSRLSPDTAGREVRLTVQRGDEIMEIAVRSAVLVE